MVHAAEIVHNWIVERRCMMFAKYVVQLVKTHRAEYNMSLFHFSSTPATPSASLQRSVVHDMF